MIWRTNFQDEVLSAASAPVVRNETITLTTDYESRISAEVSQLLQEPYLSADSTSSSQPSRSPDSPPPTLFYDPDLPSTPVPVFGCCQRPQPVAQVDSRAPPTYSALYPRSSSTDGHLPVLIDNRDPHSSFVAPDPPPSYAQAQGICVAYSLERLFSNPLATTNSDARIWSPRSTAAVCPRCATLVFTIVEVHQATVTHVAAFTLFIMGCWPCCLLPYCIDSCKTSHHYCPFCRSYLGTYNP
ncbi:hypothetical protein QAD02_019821 [Eretmocerus hayati]|uniref:Uncharacterized protein n=1 Tax=Eretmocerus hayati TaxID=131215 RepID=A0ACC2PL73_9HYME|nr:hypothetical protein QAD02_019821 [Eretmocerus hayati]